MEGMLSGETTVSQALKKGDFGVGTLNQASRRHPRCLPGPPTAPAHQPPHWSLPPLWLSVTVTAWRAAAGRRADGAGWRGVPPGRRRQLQARRPGGQGARSGGGRPPALLAAPAACWPQAHPGRALCSCAAAGRGRGRPNHQPPPKPCSRTCTPPADPPARCFSCPPAGPLQTPYMALTKWRPDACTTLHFTCRSEWEVRGRQIARQWPGLARGRAAAGGPHPQRSAAQPLGPSAAPPANLCT